MTEHKLLFGFLGNLLILFGGFMAGYFGFDNPYIYILGVVLVFSGAMITSRLILKWEKEEYARSQLQDEYDQRKQYRPYLRRQYRGKS